VQLPPWPSPPVSSPTGTLGISATSSEAVVVKVMYEKESIADVVFLEEEEE